MHLRYSEVLFVCTSGYKMDYTQRYTNNWDFESYSFNLNLLRFGSFFFIIN